jgi:hypothetical protein
MVTTRRTLLCRYVAPSPQSSPPNLNLSHIFDKGMTNMIDTKQGKYRPSCTVITAPDPDDEPFGFHTEEGGTLEIRSESRNYPSFDVVITGPHPLLSRTVTGKLTEPVVIPIPPGTADERPYTAKVTHRHHIRHKPDHTREFNFNVHPCPLCQE